MKFPLSRFKRVFFSVGASALALASLARADVTFSSSGNNFSVAPGGSITFTLSLNVDGGEDVTGLSYNLEASGPDAGVFSITGRDSSSSIFVANNSDSQVIAGPGNILNPKNQLDLGGTLNNPNSPVSNGVYTLGSFTIGISNTATAGSYAISPTFLSPYLNGDWISAGPNFDDNNISSPFSINVLVSGVPEPSSMVLLLVGVSFLALVSFRRRLARASV